MIDQREILWGIVAPPVLMAVGMAVTAYVPALRRVLPTGTLLALVVGVSLLGFRGWPAPGGDVHNWPAWIAFAAAFIIPFGQGRWPWHVAVRLVVTGIATWLLLRPQLQHGGTGEAVAWIGGAAIAWTALILAWERTHAATTQGVSAVALTTLAGLSAASLLLFNSMTHAQYAGILTAASTAALVLGWWRPAWYAPARPVTVVALVLPALWILGQRYADLPWWALPLLAIAGVAPLITASAVVRPWAAWKRVAVTVVAILVVTSPVLVWGVITSLRAAAEPGYGY